MSSSTDAKNQRYYSIDSLKILAAFAVVYLHVYGDPLGRAYGESWHWVYVLIKQTGRWAVPTFFAVSGYFFALSLQRSPDRLAVLLKYLKRLCLVWLVWSCFYLFWSKELIPSMLAHGPVKVLYWQMVQIPAWIAKDPLNAFLFGGYYHLWYLPAAAFGLLFFYYIPRWMQWPLALSVYAVCAGQSYVYELHPVYRIGLCFSPVFVLTGAWLAQNRLASTRSGILMLLAGFLIMAFEVVYFAGRGGYESFLGNLYLYGFIPLVAGLLTLALNHPEWGRHTLAKMGPYALGIYLLHPLWLDVSVPWARSPELFLFSPLWVAALSLVSAWALTKNPFLKKVVS